MLLASPTPFLRVSPSVPICHHNVTTSLTCSCNNNVPADSQHCTLLTFWNRSIPPLGADTVDALDTTNIHGTSEPACAPPLSGFPNVGSMDGNKLGHNFQDHHRVSLRKCFCYTVQPVVTAKGVAYIGSAYGPPLLRAQIPPRFSSFSRPLFGSFHPQSTHVRDISARHIIPPVANQRSNPA